MSLDNSNQAVLQCGVCLESFSQLRKPIILNCGHTVCMDCLSKFNQAKKECPFCKAKFQTNQLQTNFQLLSHDIPRKPKDDLNSKIDKLVKSYYYCQVHPESKVLNYCSTCKYFTCVECSFNHSQNNHSVKYINNSIFNDLENFQSDIKQICLNIYTSSIKPAQEKFNKVSFESTSISKSLEDYVACIDSQIVILTESRKKLKKFIVQTTQSFNSYKADIDKILGESVVNVINSFYFERNNASQSLLKLIHESIYDISARITLYDKFEIQYTLDKAKLEIEQYRNYSKSIAEMVQKSFENINQDIVEHFSTVSKTNEHFNQINISKSSIKSSVAEIEDFSNLPALAEASTIQETILELSTFSYVFNQKIENIARQLLTIN